MIIHLFDGTKYTVSNERGEAISAAIDAEIEWLDLGNVKIRTSSISKLEKSKDTIYEQPALAQPTTELTDDQRQANIERIHKMKADFMSRRQS